VIALAWLAAAAGGRRPGAGGRGESAGFLDHHRFFAHTAEKRWWSPETRFRPSPGHARVRPQVPGGAPAGGKPPALAAPPPASPASPASITS